MAARGKHRGGGSRGASAQAVGARSGPHPSLLWPGGTWGRKLKKLFSSVMCVGGGRPTGGRVGAGKELRTGQEESGGGGWR